MWTHRYRHTTTPHLSLHSKMVVATTARTDYNDLDRLARPVLQDVLESVAVLKAAEVHSQRRAACDSIPHCQQHAQAFPN